MKDKTILNTVNENPELGYLISYYRKYKENAALRRFIRVLYNSTKGKRTLRYSLLNDLSKLWEMRAKREG